MDGIAIGPDGGEKLARGTRHHRILADLPDLEVIDARFGPEFEGVDPHTHDDHTDTFYVLEGEGEFTLGDETLRLGPGSFFAAPPGVVHGFRVAGDSELRMLNVHSPNTGFVERMRRAS